MSKILIAIHENLGTSSLMALILRSDESRKKIVILPFFEGGEGEEFLTQGRNNI